MCRLKQRLWKVVWRDFQQKDLRGHTDSMVVTLKNFVWCCEKVFIHMSSWIFDTDSMKHCYQQWKNFKAI